MPTTFIEPLEPRSYFSAGDLDPTFGTGGVAAYHFPAGNPNTPVAGVSGAVEQRDGKILVATLTALLRFNHDGSLDTSFGSNGSIAVPAGVNAFGPIALQRDGKLVVEESILPPSGPTYVLARYDLNRKGALDTRFHGGSIANTFDFSRALAIQRDGKILVSGLLAGSPSAAVVRVRTDGSIDRSFGTQGAVIAPVAANPGTLFVGGVAVRADGTIALVGATTNPQGVATAFTDFFNSRGRATTIKSPRPLPSTFVPPTTNSVALDVTARQDGLFAIGSYSGGSPTGAAQNVPPVSYVSFQGQPTGTTVPIIQAIAADRRNQILVGGTTSTGWVLNRYGHDQQFDPTFGPTGGSALIPLDQSFGPPALRVIISTADGHLLAVGDNGTRDVTLARVLGSPAPDTTAPTATLLSAFNLNSAAAHENFTVTYHDNFKLKASSIRASNVVVKGPASFGTRAATLIGSDSGGIDAPSIDATYTLSGPHGGLWTPADNGVYTILLQPRQVSDTSGNLAASATLGTFTVTVLA